MTYRDAKSWIDEHSGADEEERERRELVVHTADDQCTVGADGRCSGCGATHAAPCPGCGATAYGRPGCDRCSPPPPLAIAFGAYTRTPASELDPAIVGDLGSNPREERLAAEIRSQLGIDEGPSPHAAAVIAIDLTSPAVWPVLDPARGVATSITRAELRELPREQIAAVLAGRAAAATIDAVVPCACGYPSVRSVHTGGEHCPRGEVTALPPIDWRSLASPSPVRVESVRVVVPTFAELRAAIATAPLTSEELDQVHELLECQGHEPGPRDPIGSTVYCDGSCRRGPLVRADLAAIIADAHARRLEQLDREPTTAELEEAGVSAELEAATVHGFGHADVTMRSQVVIASPPLEPGRGPRVELRVSVREADQRRGRLVSSHLLELAAAVYRATPDAGWPVHVVVAGDVRLPSGYVGRVVVELEHARERGPALEAIRAMHELGGRPW